MIHRVAPYVFFLNALHYKGYLELTFDVPRDDPKVLLCLDQHLEYEHLTGKLPKKFKDTLNHRKVSNIAYRVNMPDDEYEIWKNDIAFFKEHLTLSDSMWTADTISNMFNHHMAVDKHALTDLFRRMLNNVPFKNRKDSDVYGLIDLASKTIKTQIALLHLQEGDTLYNPFGGYAFATSALPPSVRYEGYTANYYNYIFGKIYLRCLRKPSDDLWEFSTKLLPPTRQYDHILLYFGPELSNKKRITPLGMTHSRFVGLDNPVIMNMLDRLSDKGRMTFVVPKKEVCRKQNPILKHLTDNDLLDTITEIYGYTILLLNKKKEHPGQVKYIPQHALNINFDRTLIDDSKSFVIDTRKIAASDYTLDIDLYDPNQVTCQAPHGYKAVKLAELLYPVEFGPISRQMSLPIIYDCTKDRPIQKRNYPFDYCLTAVEIKEKFVNDRMFLQNYMFNKSVCRLLDKDVLFVDYDNIVSASRNRIANLSPYWFSAKEGDLGYMGDALLCEIKPSCNVDIAYLILQMNESYFKKQVLYYCFNPDIDKWFFDLYVYMPDCETSIERQHELVAMSKTRYIKMFAESIGIHLQDIYTGEQTYLPNGTLLKEQRYRITGSLGHGGFGRTYTAVDLHSPTPRTVAIKEFFSLQLQTRNRRNGTEVQTIPEKVYNAKMALVKFHNEARLIQSCQSEYIINVYDVFDANHTSYYVMEYIDNINLYDYCQNRAVCPKEAVRIIRQLCSALSEIHSHNILHLDIKPQNILLTPGNYDVRLIDFGMSHHQTDNRDEPLLVARSSNFSAPELQYDGRRALTPATDIYSVGVTLQYMLHPFRETDFTTEEQSLLIPCEHDIRHRNISRRRLRGNSHPLQRVIEAATQYQPSRRPQSTDEFLQLLDQAVEEL